MRRITRSKKKGKRNVPKKVNRARKARKRPEPKRPSTVRVGRREVRALPLTGRVRGNTSLPRFLQKQGYFRDRRKTLEKLRKPGRHRKGVGEVSMKTMTAGGGYKTLGNKFKQTMDLLAA
jgi:hypothetical protein